jgi:hypothetical protein
MRCSEMQMAGDHAPFAVSPLLFAVLSDIKEKR